MPQINLLPWREELRKQRNKEFGVTCAVFAILMGIVIGSVHYWFNEQIEGQRARNSYIKTEIAKLDKKIEAIKDLDSEKERLLARMEIIQQLQASRPEVVHLFDEIVSTLPEGIFYSKVVQKGSALTLTGVAQSNARVSSLMRNLEDSQYLENPALVEIKREVKDAQGQESLRLSNFILRVKQEKRKAEGEDAS